MTPPPFYKTYKKTDVFIREDVPNSNRYAVVYDTCAQVSMTPARRCL